jgi:predicted CXXCH cytochrome family protein
LRSNAECSVGCERCHDPGSEHAAHPLAENIVKPSRLDAIASTDTCVHCHSQGQPLANPIEGRYYNWPVGYRVDLRLQDFWKLENCTLGETSFYYFPDCTPHKNRMQGNDYAQSVMYHRGINCADRHDVHGTSNYAQLRKSADEICLDCHRPLVAQRSAHSDARRAHSPQRRHRQSVPRLSHGRRSRVRASPAPWCTPIPSASSCDDRPRQDPQPLHALPLRQIDRLGPRIHGALARRLTVERPLVENSVLAPLALFFAPFTIKGFSPR